MEYHTLTCMAYPVRVSPLADARGTPLQLTFSRLSDYLQPTHRDFLIKILNHFNKPSGSPLESLRIDLFAFRPCEHGSGIKMEQKRF